MHPQIHIKTIDLSLRKKRLDRHSLFHSGNTTEFAAMGTATLKVAGTYTMHKAYLGSHPVGPKRPGLLLPENRLQISSSQHRRIQAVSIFFLTTGIKQGKAVGQHNYTGRSEERRVGKEGRSRWTTENER